MHTRDSQLPFRVITIWPAAVSSNVVTREPKRVSTVQILDEVTTNGFTTDDLFDPGYLVERVKTAKPFLLESPDIDTVYHTICRKAAGDTFHATIQLDNNGTPREYTHKVTLMRTESDRIRVIPGWQV